MKKGNDIFSKFLSYIKERKKKMTKLKKDKNIDTIVKPKRIRKERKSKQIETKIVEPLFKKETKEDEDIRFIKFVEIDENGNKVKTIETDMSNENFLDTLDDLISNEQKNIKQLNENEIDSYGYPMVENKEQEESLDPLMSDSLTSFIDEFSQAIKSFDQELIIAAQKEFSEAHSFAYDYKMSPGTYQILDFRKTCIAYGWWNKEKSQYEFVRNEDPTVMSKRMN